MNQKKRQIRKKVIDQDDETINTNNDTNLEQPQAFQNIVNNKDEDEPIIIKKKSTIVKKPIKKFTFETDDYDNEDNSVGHGRDDSNFTMISNDNNDIDKNIHEIKYTSEYLKGLKQQSTKTSILEKKNIDQEMLDLDSKNENDNDPIPNEQQIKLAKEKRLRNRNKSNNDDGYIPLNSSKPVKNKSKNEDDNEEYSDYSDDDDPQNTDNTSNIIKTDEIKTKPSTNYDVDMNIYEEDEDDEILNWKQSQILKGGMKTPTKSIRQDRDLIIIEEKELLQEHSNTIESSTSFITTLFQEFQEIELSNNDFTNNLTNELFNKESFLSETKINLMELQSNQHKNNDDYIYYDELKDFIYDLNDCLTSKLPLIENLENQLLDLDLQHITKVRKQRKNELIDIFNLISKETQDNMNIDSTDDNDQVDEFGRSREFYEKSLRANRLKDLRKNLENDNNMNIDNGINEKVQLFDVNEQKEYENDRNDLLEKLQSSFNNVADEFYDLSLLVQRFNHWKSKDRKSYTQSLLSYNLPKIFSPFINLQLQNWNPLIDSSFEELQWYKDLLNFGVTTMNTGNEEDIDENLLPNLIERLVIPRVEYFIQNFYEITSMKHLDKIIEFIKDTIEIYYNGPHQIELRNNIIKELLNSLLSLESTTLSIPAPKVLLEEEIFTSNDKPLFIRYIDNHLETYLKYFSVSLKFLNSLKDYIVNGNSVGDVIKNNSENLIFKQFKLFNETILSFLSLSMKLNSDSDDKLNSIFTTLENFFNFTSGLNLYISESGSIVDKCNFRKLSEFLDKLIIMRLNNNQNLIDRVVLLKSKIK